MCVWSVIWSLPEHPETKSMRRQGYPKTNNMVVEQLIKNYVEDIQKLGSIFDAASLLLDSKQEQEKINTELRDRLAQTGSLRRKDFDRMMQGVLSVHNDEEVKVRGLLSAYLNEQKGIAQTLNEKLARFKESLAKGEAERVDEFQAFFKEILAQQEERKAEITLKLKEFQKEQEVMAGKLRQLLAAGRELRARDLKAMLKELGSQRKERQTRQEERKLAVRELLFEARKYKKEGD